MKRNGILNAGVLDIVSAVGHGDLIAITDRGFPLSRLSVTTAVDVSVVPGVPGIADLLPGLADILVVEELIVAEETQAQNRAITAVIRSAFPEVPERVIPHSDFKQLVLGGAKDGHRMVGQIRTAEYSRYGNVILVCGVGF
jgi:D-ribose pyranase